MANCTAAGSFSLSENRRNTRLPFPQKCLRSSLPVSSTTEKLSSDLVVGPTGSHVDQQNLSGQANHTCLVQGSGEIQTKQTILAKRPRSNNFTNHFCHSESTSFQVRRLCKFGPLPGVRRYRDHRVKRCDHVFPIFCRKYLLSPKTTMFYSLAGQGLDETCSSSFSQVNRRLQFDCSWKKEQPQPNSSSLQS